MPLNGKVNHQSREKNSGDPVATHSLGRSLRSFAILNRSSSQRVIADDAPLLLAIGDNVSFRRTGTAGSTGMTNEPYVQRALSTLEGIDRVPPVEGLRARKSGHVALLGPRARKEICELWTDPRGSIQNLHQTLPVIRSDAEAVSICQQSLRSLSPTLDKELRQRLTLSVRSAIKKGPILRVDSKIELFLSFSHCLYNV